jgi:hypothetical protein
VLGAAAFTSAHVAKGLRQPTLATAFVSSPSSGADAPIPIAWSTHDTKLSVACFYVANTSPDRVDRPGWPRITNVGFELPGSLAGFALVGPLTGDWKLVEGVRASLPGYEPVTLDFAIVARVNPTGRAPGEPDDPRGIPPGQPATRGSGTEFCVSGPFPSTLPDLATADPDDTVATTIEGLINGVVVGFRGVPGDPIGKDAAVWFPPPGTNPRAIPLYP